MKKLRYMIFCLVGLGIISVGIGTVVIPKVMADDGGPAATVEYFATTTGGIPVVENGLVKLTDEQGSRLVDTTNDTFGYIEFKFTFNQDIRSGDEIGTTDITISAVKQTSDSSAIEDHDVVVDSTERAGIEFKVNIKVPNALFNNIPITIDVALTENVVRTPGGLGNVPLAFSIRVVSEFPSEANAIMINITESINLASKAFLIVGRRDDATLITSRGTTADDELPSTPASPLTLVGNTSGSGDNDGTPALPDLRDFFTTGGTIDVFVETDEDTPPNVVINEVMWAADENSIQGSPGYIAHQWIELYNDSTENINADDITLRFVPGTVLPSTRDLTTPDRKWTDRLSNVASFAVGNTVRTGWTLGNKGQNGSSNASSRRPFVSMYRKIDKLGDDDGINGENWLRSTRTSHSNHIGTPGAANSRQTTVFTPRTLTMPSTFTPPKNRVIINEVYNAENNDEDWIEIRALQDTDLENWTLSYVTRAYSETELFRFPKYTLEADEVLLIVNKPPDETDLAAGQDITRETLGQARGAGPHKYLIMEDRVHIPDVNNGNFYIILREAKGYERYTSSVRIHDVVGTLRAAAKTLNAQTVRYEPHTGDPGNIWETDVWPLNGNNNAKPDDVYLQTNRNFSVGNVWQRNGTMDGWKKDGGFYVGFQGGIGYDRSVAGKGTPGYRYGRGATLQTVQVYISELMLTQGRRNLPQWIEIRNTSATELIDLHRDTDGDDGTRQGWSLAVENHHSGLWEDNISYQLNVEVTFRDLGIRYILPNQTILIVSNEVARSRHSGHFPAHRVASIWKNAKNAFGMSNRSSPFLNTEGGFLIRLINGAGTVVDEVGNLDGEPANVRDGVGFDDPFSWSWPTDLTTAGQRSSLIRIMNADGTPRWGVPNRRRAGSLRGAVLPLGKKGKQDEYAWVHAVDAKLQEETYYGDQSDKGTPGHIYKTPLPVSLSFFRPTLEDGEVVIRWTTESELDNAGFNIYRSESRDGEFKQVNAELIRGKGTTGERSTYKWVDTTAKPDAVYFYQIEDVSFAGERQTLATTKLKGLISAKNKLTTTWSTFKKEIQETDVK